MSKLQMPERGDKDGPVKVERVDGFIILSETYDGVEKHITVSEYNAWRLLGMLSIILGVPLSREAGKAIRL